MCLWSIQLADYQLLMKGRQNYLTYSLQLKRTAGNTGHHTGIFDSVWGLNTIMKGYKNVYQCILHEHCVMNTYRKFRNDKYNDIFM